MIDSHGSARMAPIRVNNSVLGALERPTLAWLVDHLPAWVMPNHLTLVGVLGAVLTAAGFILSRWSLSWLWLASLGLLVNWLGDSLDGTLARRRRIERPRYGFFVDHISDLFSQAIIFLALGLSPCAHFAVACLGLIAFLMAFVYTLIGAHVHNTMRITYFGFGPTEIRALLFLGNLPTLAVGVIYLQPRFAPLAAIGPVTGHDLGISIISAVAVGLIAALAIREGRALAAEDSQPAAKLRSKGRRDFEFP
ncbi:MAG: CDP-alcohol phosphatidyltransferase family protein [Steroidobacteraceae bacterium]